MAIALVFAFALGLLAWLVFRPTLLRRRRARVAARAFPQGWRRLLRRRVPLVSRLPADQQLRLKKLMQVFLAEKPILGCAGLQVTDEMRVTIAALACLPLLGRSRGFYPELRQVLLYPGAFVVERPVNVGGVQMEQRRALAGESWSQGQVLLAWDHVLRDASHPGDGRNVVVHEFAHQLDQVKGFANGAPPLASAADYARWSTVMQAEYDALRTRVAQGSETGLLDAYGATDPAEFFAVASEVFFERGTELAAWQPALYAELRRYYAVETAAWN